MFELKYSPLVLPRNATLNYHSVQLGGLLDDDPMCDYECVDGHRGKLNQIEKAIDLAAIVKKQLRWPRGGSFVPRRIVVS